jgi:hypothetical protein
MMRFFARLFGRSAPTLSEARPNEASAIAALHKTSFQRGWGEDEVYRLLIEKTVVGARPRGGPNKNRFMH